ncbi:MAG: hypothetical protein ACI80N_004297, partial [Gammaproteobacteria bacterium]
RDLTVDEAAHSAGRYAQHHPTPGTGWPRLPPIGEPRQLALPAPLSASTGIELRFSTPWATLPSSAADSPVRP